MFPEILDDYITENSVRVIDVFIDKGLLIDVDANGECTGINSNDEYLLEFAYSYANLFDCGRKADFYWIFYAGNH